MLSDFAVQELKSTRMQSTGEPRRSLGLAATTSIVIGNMVGSGIFLLPASMAPYGVYSLWGWVISTAGARSSHACSASCATRAEGGRPLRLSA